MEHNAKICKIIINGKEQNLNKCVAGFEISIVFQYFLCTLAKLNTFSRSWKWISQFYTSTFSILLILCRNPGACILLLTIRWITYIFIWIVKM